MIANVINDVRASHPVSELASAGSMSDLLLDGTTAIGKSGMLEAVRDGIRRGEVQIDLRGYSHVFVSTSANDDAGLGEQSMVADVPHDPARS